jgi:conjugal transfer pilus assembly protein TrbC
MKPMDILHNPNVVMVLRGFVGGMKRIQPTMDFWEKLLAVDPGCKLAEGEKCRAFRANIEIDPLVFRRLGVSRVPAIAYVSKTSGTSIDQGSGSGPGEIDASVVYGDVNLTYALEKLYKDTGDEGLREAAESLRSGYYHN